MTRRGAIVHPRDRFDAVKGRAVRGGELGQAAQLRKRVGEVVAVRIDNGDLYILAVTVEEEEIGSLAGRNDTNTSARGQSQPVEIASLANNTRMWVRSCTVSGPTCGTVNPPSSIGACSPNTVSG